jgi:hypothetical protein
MGPFRLVGTTNLWRIRVLNRGDADDPLPEGSAPPSPAIDPVLEPVTEEEDDIALHKHVDGHESNLITE